MTWLRRLNPLVWWRARQRAVDHAILIPIIAPMGDAAFAAVFGAHAAMDPAWRNAEWWEFSERDLALIHRAISVPSECHSEKP